MKIVKFPKEVLEKAEIIGNVFEDMAIKNKALNDLAEILSSDNAFESDCVRMDKKATKREKILADVISDCYSIIHPLTSECCKLKEFPPQQSISPQIVGKCKMFTEDCYGHPKCMETLKEGGKIHPPLDKIVDNLVRDVTKVGSIPKSEVKRRISELLEAYRNLDIPPGVSQWRNAGEKWGYDKFWTVIKDEKLTRVEVINHSSCKQNDFGRCFVHWSDEVKVELSVQDNERTLKIFLDDKIVL